MDLHKIEPLDLSDYPSVEEQLIQLYAIYIEDKASRGIGERVDSISSKGYLFNTIEEAEFLSIFQNQWAEIWVLYCPDTHGQWEAAGFLTLFTEKHYAQFTDQVPQTENHKIQFLKLLALKPGCRFTFIDRVLLKFKYRDQGYGKKLIQEILTKKDDETDYFLGFSYAYNYMPIRLFVNSLDFYVAAPDWKSFDQKTQEQQELTSLLVRHQFTDSRFLTDKGDSYWVGLIRPAGGHKSRSDSLPELHKEKKKFGKNRWLFLAPVNKTFTGSPHFEFAELCLPKITGQNEAYKSIADHLLYFLLSSTSLDRMQKTGKHIRKVYLDDYFKIEDNKYQDYHEISRRISPNRYNQLSKKLEMAIHRRSNEKKGAQTVRVLELGKPFYHGEKKPEFLKGIHYQPKVTFDLQDLKSDLEGVSSLAQNNQENWISDPLSAYDIIICNNFINLLRDYKNDLDYEAGDKQNFLHLLLRLVSQTNIILLCLEFEVAPTANLDISHISDIYFKILGEDPPISWDLRKKQQGACFWWYYLNRNKDFSVRREHSRFANQFNFTEIDIEDDPRVSQLRTQTFYQFSNKVFQLIYDSSYYRIEVPNLKKAPDEIIQNDYYGIGKEMTRYLDEYFGTEKRSHKSRIIGFVSDSIKPNPNEVQKIALAPEKMPHFSQLNKGGDFHFLIFYESQNLTESSDNLPFIKELEKMYNNPWSVPYSLFPNRILMGGQGQIMQKTMHLSYKLSEYLQKIFFKLNELLASSAEPYESLLVITVGKLIAPDYTVGGTQTFNIRIRKEWLEDTRRGKEFDHSYLPGQFNQFLSRFLLYAQNGVSLRLTRLVNEHLFRLNKDAYDDALRAAIISILVDSYAHNMAAHSLVALKYWFEVRSRLWSEVLETAPNPFFEEIGFQSLLDIEGKKSHGDFIGRLQDQIIEEMNLNQDAPNVDWKTKIQSILQPYGSLPAPLAQVIYPFFQYLRDKSSFWSGATRDILFGSQSISWYDLLAKGFINNPLFIGTIAFSEGIHRVNFHVQVENTKGKPRAKGHFASVDLSLLNKDSEALRYELTPDPAYDDSPTNNAWQGFLEEGKKYAKIRDELRSLPMVFLPNGVIGQHAFYTILENELRNVKHIKEDLKSIQKNGLDIWIAIRPVPFDPEKSTKNVLFRVGCWLNHPQVASSPENPYEAYKIQERITNLLFEEIIQEQQRIPFGGNAQDRICAAMLLNNHFSSIHPSKDNFRFVKHSYYPYIMVATGKIKKKQKDHFMHARYRVKRPNLYKNQNLIKKYFHLWQSEDYYLLDKQVEDLDLHASDNLVRYKVIGLDDSIVDWFHHGRFAFDTLRNLGIIRIIRSSKQAEKNYDEAIATWLTGWFKLKENQQVILKLYHGELEQTFFGAIVLGFYAESVQPVIRYLNYKKFKLAWEWDWTIRDILYRYSELDHLALKDENKKGNLFQYLEGSLLHKLHLKHKPNSRQQVALVRQHGYFMAEYYQGYTLDSANNRRGMPLISQANLAVSQCAELLESVLTRVCIFDNRIYERIPAQKLNIFHQELRLHFFKEEEASWSVNEDPTSEAYLQLSQSHFLIMHLSFIERLIEQYDIAPNGDKVRAFFDHQIKPVIQERDNFLLIITTGRGGRGWFKSIEHPQISFRPIEALIEAVEDGVSRRDDYQIAHNLSKILFGS